MARRRVHRREREWRRILFYIVTLAVVLSMALSLVLVALGQ